MCIPEVILQSQQNDDGRNVQVSSSMAKALCKGAKIIRWAKLYEPHNIIQVMALIIIHISIIEVF